MSTDNVILHQHGKVEMEREEEKEVDGVEKEEDEEEAERHRRVRLSILQKLPRVTGPFVNEIESPVTAVPRRRNIVLANREPAAYVKPEERVRAVCNRCYE